MKEKRNYLTRHSHSSVLSVHKYTSLYVYQEINGFIEENTLPFTTLKDCFLYLLVHVLILVFNLFSIRKWISRDTITYIFFEIKYAPKILIIFDLNCIFYFTLRKKKNNSGDMRMCSLTINSIFSRFWKINQITYYKYLVQLVHVHLMANHDASFSLHLRYEKVQ